MIILILKILQLVKKPLPIDLLFLLLHLLQLCILNILRFECSFPPLLLHLLLMQVFLIIISLYFPLLFLLIVILFLLLHGPQSLLSVHLLLLLLVFLCLSLNPLFFSQGFHLLLFYLIFKLLPFEVLGHSFLLVFLLLVVQHVLSELRIHLFVF